MRSFFDFSNDTFYQIINHIHPDDILNFSVSCKWVHMMTKATLKQHASWTQAYTHVVLDGCHRHQNDRHPLRLIRDVCLDWRIGELPKTLELECCGVVELDEDDSDVQEDEEEHENETRVDEIAIQAIMQDDKGYIEKKAAATGYLDRDQLDNLFAYIQCGYRGAMIGLLLLILPNLESISFREFTWNAASLTTIADLIADRNLQSHPPRSIALGKLSHIHIFDYKNNPRGEDLEFLVPFAALPSMRKLSGISVITVDDDPMVWPFDLRVSNVTEITLLESALGIESLTQMFSGITALKRFTYSHSPLLDTSPMEAHMVIGALLEHARDSLEYLALTGHCGPRDSEEDYHINKGSLQSFKVLKEVSFHTAIYVDQMRYYVASGDPDEPVYKERNRNCIRALVDILPPSIETVKLSGPEAIQHIDGVHHTDGLLATLGETKELRFPRLKQIVFVPWSWQDWTPRHEKWVKHKKQACDRLGMTFKAELQFASEQGKWRAREEKRADLREVYRRRQIRTVSFEQFWSDFQSGRLVGKEAT